MRSRRTTVRVGVVSVVGDRGLAVDDLHFSLGRRFGGGRRVIAVVDGKQLRVERRGLFVVEGVDGDDLTEATLTQGGERVLRETEGLEALCDAGLRGREGLVEGGGL